MVLFLHHSSGFSVPRPPTGLMRIHWVMGQVSLLGQAPIWLWVASPQTTSVICFHLPIYLFIYKGRGKELVWRHNLRERGSRAGGGGHNSSSPSGILYWIGVLAVRVSGRQNWCTPLIDTWEGWGGGQKHRQDFKRLWAVLFWRKSDKLGNRLGWRLQFFPCWVIS